MRALVVGGTGYIGSRLCRALAERGWDVTAFALAPAGEDHPARLMRGDRHDVADLRRLRGLADQDVVVDLAAYRASDTRSMLDTWAGRTGCFVHLSTIAVYRRILEPLAREEATERWYTGDRGYGADKAGCERELESRMDVRSVVLRAAPLMGPADAVSRENWVLKRILADRPVHHPGPLDGHIHLLHVDDLVRAVLAALERAEPGCRAYHLAQGESVALAQHVAAIGSLAGRPDVTVEEVPLELLAAHRLRLCGFPFGVPSAQRLLVERAATELGFVPTPYAEALAATVAWLRPRARSFPAWPGRGTTQSRLCGTHEWLHADQERALRMPVPPVRLERVDELLSWLSGVQRGEGRRVVMTGEAWSAPGGLGPEGAAAAAIEAADPGAPCSVLVLPGPLLGRLAIPAGCGETRRRTMRPDPAWRLAGVVEPEAAGSDEKVAWLYGQVAPDDVLAYGRGGAVSRVRFSRFQELDPDGVPEQEQVVVSLADDEDAAAFVEWLVRCDDGGHIESGSLRSYARVFLTHLCRWVPGGRGDRVEIWPPQRAVQTLCPCSGPPGRVDSEPCQHVPGFLEDAYSELRRRAPGAGAWATVFDLARILLASDAAAPDASPLALSTPRHSLVPLPGLEPATAPGSLRLAPGLQVLRVGARAYAADISTRRLLELSPRLVAVVEVAHRCHGRGRSVDVLHSLLGTDRDDARRIFDAGTVALEQSGVLERRHDCAVADTRTEV